MLGSLTSKQAYRVPVNDWSVLCPCPQLGWATVVHFKAWPALIRVLEWHGEAEELAEALLEDNWRRDHLALDSECPELAPYFITPSQPSILLSQEDFRAGLWVNTWLSLKSASRETPVLRVAVDRIDDRVLQSVIDVLQEFSAAHDDADPFVALEGGVDWDASLLWRFVLSPRHAIIPRLSSFSWKSLQAELLGITSLADEGAFCPIAIYVDDSTCSATDIPWSDIADANRGNGFILVPSAEADPLAFADLVIRLYQQRLTLAERLFPLNIFFATFTGQRVAPAFRANPVPRPVDRLIDTDTTDVCSTAVLEACCNHAGVNLPESWNERLWFQAACEPLLTFVVREAAELIVQSYFDEQHRATTSTATSNTVVDVPDRVLTAAREASTHQSISISPAITSATDKRRYRRRSLPHESLVSAIDLDVTKRCNLRCTYCFKGGTVHEHGPVMSLDVAKAAVDWLIDASGGASQLWVNLLGGEPLLQWDMVEELVPYAKQRAARFGKAIQFGTTTNLTLVTSEIVEFSKQWGMGWHCSIDGIPAVQDTQRPRKDGTTSHEAAERGARLILDYRPLACARATITPANVSYLYDSILYFIGLGFSNCAVATAEEEQWTPHHIDEYDRQWALATQYYIDNEQCKLIAFPEFWRRMYSAQSPGTSSCGAGRGYVMIDAAGDIWPCHRWDATDAGLERKGAWRLGNIFNDEFNHRAHLLHLHRDEDDRRMVGCDTCELERFCCGGCPAANLALTGDMKRMRHTTCAVTRITYKHAQYAYQVLRDRNDQRIAEALK